MGHLMLLNKDSNNYVGSYTTHISCTIILGAAPVLYVVSCASGTLCQNGGMFQYRIWHSLDSLLERQDCGRTGPIYRAAGRK
jgi:hypothetical protein